MLFGILFTATKLGQQLTMWTWCILIKGLLESHLMKKLSYRSLSFFRLTAGLSKIKLVCICTIQNLLI